MAIVAQDQVTLQTISGFTGTVTYYLLQSSALNPPLKPSTSTPTGGWTTTEPAFSFDATLTLYTVPKNLFGVNQFEYGAVQKSSQYEAAKAAYNKAVSTDNSASKTVTAEYAQVTSSTVAPTSGWVGTQPMARAGYFTWLRFKFVTGNGTISYSTPTNISVPQLYSITPYYHRVSNEDYDPILRTVPEPWADWNDTLVGENDRRITETGNHTVTIVYAMTLIPETAARYLLDSPWTDGRRAYVWLDGYFMCTAGLPSVAGSPAITGLNIGAIKIGNGIPISTVFSDPGDGVSIASIGTIHRALVFDTELSTEQITAVTDWLMAGHYLDAPGTPIGVPELPIGNLNNAGRNLVAATKYVSNGGGLFVDATSTYQGRPSIRSDVGTGIVHPWLRLENGVTYTYSAMIKRETILPNKWGSSPMHYWVGLNDIRQGNLTIVSADQDYPANSLGKWKKVSLTFYLNSDANSFRPFVYVDNNTGLFTNIADIKLEKGSVATAWTPAPEDNVEYWQKIQSDWKDGTTLYGTNLIEFNDGTFQYTPVTQISSEQAASDALYISNLAKELAEGLVDLSPSMPENPLPGQVWISQDEKKNMTGVWRFNGSEWQQSSILTGLIMVPGEDGQMTLIGPKGIDAPSVLADIIRTEVLYAEVGGVKKFIVSDIPRENLEDGVKTALDTAESIGTRIVLDGSKGELIIARDKYQSGVSDTMTVLTASSMNFMFDGKAVTSIDSATRQLTTVNAQVQGALRFPSHTIKTLPGTSILVFQQA